MKLMLIIIMMTSIISLLMNHPMTIGWVLALQTLNTALMSGLLMNSFWFSYVLTITMLSGMLVLFIYMSNTSSNESFKSPMVLMLMMTLLLMSYTFNFNTFLPEEELLLSAPQMSVMKMFTMQSMSIMLY